MDYSSSFGLTGKSGGYVTGAGAEPSQPAGVASRVQELQKAVAELQSVAGQVKSALGLSTPEETGAAPFPSSLADVLTNSRIGITRATRDLEDVLQHLNS